MEAENFGELVTEVARQTDAELNDRTFLVLRVMVRDEPSADPPIPPGIAFMGLFATINEAKGFVDGRTGGTPTWSSGGRNRETTEGHRVYAGDRRYQLSWLIQDLKEVQ